MATRAGSRGGSPRARYSTPPRDAAAIAPDLLCVASEAGMDDSFGDDVSAFLAGGPPPRGGPPRGAAAASSASQQRPFLGDPFMALVMAQQFDGHFASDGVLAQVICWWECSE